MKPKLTNLLLTQFASRILLPCTPHYIYDYPPPQSKTDDFVFSQTPLILKTYQLFRIAQPLINKFPKPWRYSIGESIQKSILSIIETTCQALYARQPLKEPYILRVIGSIQSLQLYIRLAIDEKLITEQQYFMCSKQIVELNRMAIGWLKATRGP